jgi:hypothetical protein
MGTIGGCRAGAGGAKAVDPINCAPRKSVSKEQRDYVAAMVAGRKLLALTRHPM